MIEKIQNILSKAGISPEQLPPILDYIKEPPPGSTGIDERVKLTEQAIVLNILIILSTDLKRFKEDAFILLNSLIKEEGLLTEFDRGRLFHIKAYIDWRVNNSLYLACDGLNTSLRILTGERSGEAKLYRARVHDTYGQILKSQGLLNDARDEYETSLLLREGSGDDFGTAITLGNLGRLNFELGNFQKAADYLARDLEIAKKSIKNETVEAQLLNTMARCLMETGDFTEAEKLLLESLELNTKSNNLTGLCYNYLTFTSLNLQSNHLSFASEYLENVSDIIGKQEISSFFLGEIEAERMKLYAESLHYGGELSEAVKSYRLAVEVYCNSTSFSPVEKAKLIYGFAEVLKKQGNKTEASQYYRKSLQYLDTTEAFKLRNKIENELLAENKDSWVLHSAGRFIGHNQIDNLLDEAGEEGFRGELKTAAVLFCDINDFTSISEKFNPEDLIRFLNEFFRLMTRSIEHYDGFVDKFIGDAVMAVFVASDQSPQEEKRISHQSCMAALMMMSELERFNRKLKPGIPSIKISTGIHTGECVAGLIGSPQKRSYTFMGDTVNTASRIEGLAKLLGAGILISEQVACRLEDQDNFLLRPAGKFNPKGKEISLVVSELMGIDDHTSQAEQVREEIGEVSKCLLMFQKREFPEVCAGFEKMCHQYHNSPRVKGYEFLGAKAKSFLIDPPPENWDGEIKLYSK